VAFWFSGLAGAGRLSANRYGTKTTVAKTTPGEFIRQVRAETAKVVWPTRRETMMTAIMVVIMTVILSLFFFGLDSAFGAVVKSLMSLVG
jgi:preprotein translocase subunit SecE